MSTMVLPTMARSALALLLLWLAAWHVSPAHAWPKKKVKIDAAAMVKFNVRVEDGTKGPQAPPWYLYFPQEPNPVATPGSTVYPPWPNQFPPEQKAPAPEQGPSPTPGVPARPTSMSAYNQPYAPSGTPWSQVPSYWYGR